MARVQTTQKCKSCGGIGTVQVQKSGVHSSDPKRRETVWVTENCKYCIKGNVIVWVDVPDKKK